MNCTSDHNWCYRQMPRNANNTIVLEGPFHEAMNTHLTETTQDRNQCAKDQRIQEAISSEAHDLVRRGTIKVVTCAKILLNANVLTARSYTSD